MDIDDLLNPPRRQHARATITDVIRDTLSQGSSAYIHSVIESRQDPDLIAQLPGAVLRIAIIGELERCLHEEIERYAKGRAHLTVHELTIEHYASESSVPYELRQYGVRITSSPSRTVHMRDQPTFP